MPPGQPTHYSLVKIGTQKVLVRHTADGFRKDKANVLTKIVPKLEYQTHYGGEMMGRFLYITNALQYLFLKYHDF